jgi:peptidoglycan/xylan/chitin deacetylase (PgdA/CDA1 family)
MKRLFVFGVSYLFFFGNQLRRVCLRLMGRRVSGRCVVLQYHAVPLELREKFAKQMDIVLRCATPVRADSHAPLTGSDNYVAVTFDDGLTSFLENALPELEIRKIPAALFVVVGKLGTVPAWNRYSSDSAWTSVPSLTPNERMLMAEQVQELAGKVLIGSHGLAHRKLTDLDAAGVSEELEGSRRQLESLIGRKVTLFSFPYGAFSTPLISRCKDAGYERVFTIEPELAFRNPQEVVTGRICVDPTDWPMEFRLKITGCYTWLPHAVAAKRSLVRVLRFFRATTMFSFRWNPRWNSAHNKTPKI